MSSLIYNANLGDRPGLHALLIGVSDYPNLTVNSAAPPADPPGPPDFGLQSLTATASSANHLARWLVDHHNYFPVPLATCRLLLSPSAAELAADPTRAGRGEMADIANAFNAANAWRKSAASNPDNISFFYFAGHGLLRPDIKTETDQALLLREFGDNPDMIFRHSLSVNELIDGMAPGNPGSPLGKIARTQYFLFDACRNAPQQLFNDYKTAPSSGLWDIPRLPVRYGRETFILHATAPDSSAYSHPNGFTHLAVALLRCLDGGVGELDSVIDLRQPQWNVTAGALAHGIQHYLEAESKATHVVQRVTLNSQVANDTVFCRLDQAPNLPLTILLDPASACHDTQVQFHSEPDEMAVLIHPPIEPHPHTFPLKAGVYHYHHERVTGGSTVDFLTNKASPWFAHEKLGKTRRIIAP